MLNLLNDYLRLCPTADKFQCRLQDVMSTLGAKWKELSAEEKQVYMDQSKLPVGDGMYVCVCECVCECTRREMVLTVGFCTDEEMPVEEKEVVVAVPFPAVKENKKNTKAEKKEAPKKKAVAKKAQVSDDNESDSGSEEEE